MDRFPAAFCLALCLTPLDARAAFELDDLETGLPCAGLFGNPAALAAISHFSWQLAHHLPFGLRELSRHSLGLALPVENAVLGAGSSSTGFHLHRELGAWLGAGLRLNSRLAAGASLRVRHLRQRGAKPQRAAGMDLGLDFQLGRQWELSAWWQRVPGGPCRQQLRVKLARRFDACSALHVHLRHRPTRPLRLDLAAATWPHPRLRLHLGLRAAPRRFVLGVGVAAGGWRFTYAVTTHARLGPTYSFVVGST